MDVPAQRAVFLSYARQDADVVRRIAEALRGAGVEVWFDQRELRGGDTWDANIRRHIQECALFVPIISSHTQARTEGYFRREWKLAVNRLEDIADGIPFLVPVCVDETPEGAALVPRAFLAVHWVRLPSGEVPPTFGHRMRQLLDDKKSMPVIPAVNSVGTPRNDHTLGASMIQADVQSASKGRTQNAQAYTLYLQARYFAARLTPEDVTRAIDYFRQAVDVDPTFALAWAELARTYSTDAAWIGGRSFQEGFKLSRAAVERALALEPDLVEGLGARYRIESMHDWEWQRAEETIHRALALVPNNATVVSDAALIAFFLGRKDAALELGARAVQLDPVNAEARLNHAFINLWFGRLREAEAEALRVRELNPAMPFGSGMLALVYVLQRRFDEALIAAEGDHFEWCRLYIVAIARSGQGRRTESEVACQMLIEKHGEIAAYQVAQIFAYQNELDRAFAWLEKARALHDTGLAWAKMDPLFESLRPDARWMAFLKNIGLADEHAP